MILEMYLIRKGTENAISEVWPFCFTSPLSRVVTTRFSGSNPVTIEGPTGQNVSNDFAARKLHVLVVAGRARSHR